MTKIALKKVYCSYWSDTRESGVTISDALISGLNQYEVKVLDARVVPTPAIARAVLDQHADLGIAITASHNPSCDNGIKLFNHCGHKLDDAQEIFIESLIDIEPEPPVKLPSAVSSLDASCSISIT